MSVRTQRLLLLTGVLLLLVAAVGWRLRYTPAPRVREIVDATIAKLDPATRSAEVEFVHPKTGRTMRIAGTLAPACRIFINDRPARFDDLHVGDTGSVTGLIRRKFGGYAVEAQLVRITRLPAATPSTAPAGAGP